MISTSLNRAGADLQYPVYVVLRPSPDWATQTYADLEKTRVFCRNIGRPETLIIDRVKLWDQTLAITFFASRQNMKEISLENFRAVAGASLIRISDIGPVLRPDAYYLFTDDDDWYHPAVAKALQKFDPRKRAAIQWKGAVISDGMTYLDTGMFWSNNYAVSGSYLLQRKENLDIVCQHYRADGAFRAKLAALHRRAGFPVLFHQLFHPGYRVWEHLEEYLSIENKHPASTVILENMGEHPTAGDLRGLIRNIMKANRETPLPDAFQWIRPYLDSVYSFYQKLLNE